MVVNAGVRADVASMKSRLEVPYTVVFVLVTLLVSAYFHYVL